MKRSLLLFFILQMHAYLFKSSLFARHARHEDPATFIQDTTYSRYIWMYYEGTPSNEVQRMINITRTTLSREWTVTLLDNSTIDDYIPHSFSELLTNLRPALKSDIIRLRLLEEYGGWWIDATSIVTSNDLLNEIYSNVQSGNYELFGFCFVQCPRKLIESNVLYAPKGSSIIIAWLNEIMKALSMGIENYIYSIHRSGIELPSQLFLPYPTVRPYFLIYATQQAAFDYYAPRKAKILSYEADSYSYKLLADCNWNDHCIVQSLHKELSEPRYPITKIWHYFRSLTWGESSNEITHDKGTLPTLDAGTRLTFHDYMHLFLWYVINQFWILPLSLSITVLLTTIRRYIRKRNKER